MGEGVKAAATCTFTGECADKAKSDVCTSKGQTCVDPRPDVADDWTCQCVAPTTGVPAVMTVAECGTDECISTCATCENDVCKAAGQMCVDPNVKEANNWECHCIAPQTGDVAVTAATTCIGMRCVDYSEQPVCDEDPACEYNTDASLCMDVVVVQNGTNISAGASNEGGDDDDDCILCWLLPLLLLLCCLCFLLAFLLCRRKQQQTEADDEKWNKQFEAEVEEGDDENLGVRSPSQAGADADPEQSLLQGEEMSAKGNDDDI